MVLSRYIDEKLRENNEKFLIFAVHVTVMDAISDLLTRNKIRFMRIDGTTNAVTRTKNIESFQNDPELRVAVLSIRACATGITLTSASTVVFAELDWTPALLMQSEGRAHRIGQEKEVSCYYLIAPGTADDIIWKMVQEKQNTLKQVGLIANNEHFSQYTTTSFNAAAGLPAVGVNPTTSRITDFFQPNRETNLLHTCQAEIDDIMTEDDLRAIEELEKKFRAPKADPFDEDDFFLDEDDLKNLQNLENEYKNTNRAM